MQPIQFPKTSLLQLHPFIGLVADITLVLNKSPDVVKVVGHWDFSEDVHTPDEDTNIWFEKIVG